MVLYFKKGKTIYKITPKKYPKLCGLLATRKDLIKKQYDDWVKDPIEFLFPRLVLYDENGYTTLQKELNIKDRMVEIFKDTVEEKNKVVQIFSQGLWNELKYEYEFTEEQRKIARDKEAEELKQEESKNNLKIVKK